MNDSQKIVIDCYPPSNGPRFSIFWGWEMVATKGPYRRSEWFDAYDNNGDGPTARQQNDFMLNAIREIAKMEARCP